MELQTTFIPIIVDVERNIDGIKMIRCSYYSIQSDEPMPNWSLNIGRNNAAMLLLNLEAILLGSPDSPDNFRNVNDIDAMYYLVEEHEGLFVDINDIWVPKRWFGKDDLKQGLLFRISQESFSWCWKFRNDVISAEEFLAFEKEMKDSYLRFSEEETNAFYMWTEKQILQSRDIYQEKREQYLQKIKE